MALDTVHISRYRLGAGSKRVMPQPGEPLLHLALVNRGGLNVAVTARANQRWRVTAGQGLFLRSKRDYLFSRPAGTEVVMVTAPESIVRSFGARIDDSQSPVFAEASAVFPAVAAFFSALVTEERHPDRVARDATSRLAEQMLGSLFLERNSLAADAEPAPVPAPLYHQALALIASRRSDPLLTVPRVAAELAVSVRHLQRAFQDRGTSPTEEIRRLRVELAQSLLTGGHFEAASIEDVAQHSGFSSADDLRRAFRALGLSSPARLRSASRHAQRSPISLGRLGTATTNAS